MLFRTVVLGTWDAPDGTDVFGFVSFALSPGITDPTDGESVPAQFARAEVVEGSMSQALVATDAPGIVLDPPTAQYFVTERIVGAPDVDYWVSVPAVPPGAREVVDGVASAGERTLGSATAAFGGGDVGKVVFCPAFPVGSTISSVESSTSATLSGAATETASGLVVVVGASVALTAIRPS